MRSSIMKQLHLTSSTTHKTRLGNISVNTWHIGVKSGCKYYKLFKKPHVKLHTVIAELACVWDTLLDTLCVTKIPQLIYKSFLSLNHSQVYSLVHEYRISGFSNILCIHLIKPVVLLRCITCVSKQQEYITKLKPRFKTVSK